MNAEYYRKYYESNRDKLKAKRRKWAKANSDKVNAYSREYYKANRNMVIDKQKDRAKKWRMAHPEKKRENGRKWDKANPEKKRAIERKLTENLTLGYIKRLLKRQGFCKQAIADPDVINIQRTIIKIKRIINGAN